MKEIPILSVKNWEISFNDKDNVMFVCNNPKCINDQDFYSVIDFSFSHIIAFKFKENDKILIIKGIHDVYRVEDGCVPIYKIRYDQRIEEKDKILSEMI